MTNPSPSRPDLSFGLGTSGVIRVLAIPKISITLSPLVGPFDSAAPKLEVKGTADNVKGPMSCALRWLFSPDGEGSTADPRILPCAEELVLTPDRSSGSLAAVPFKIKDKAGGGKIKCDAMALGLYGKGTLGCEVELRGLPVSLVFRIAPADSALAIDTRLELSLLGQDGNPLPPDKLQIGTPALIRPFFSSVFQGKTVVGRIHEVGIASGGTKAADSSHEWRISSSAPDDVPLWVGNGMNAVPSAAAAPVPNLDYRARELTPATQNLLEYQYAICFQTSAGKDEDPKVAQPATGRLIRVGKPKLTELSLALVDLPPSTQPAPSAAHEETPDAAPAPDAVPIVQQALEVKGKIEGVAADFPLPLQLQLYCHFKQADGSVCHLRVKDIATETPNADLLNSETATVLKEGQFTKRLLCLGSQDNPFRQVFAALGNEVKFFAVLRLPTNAVSGSQPIILGDVVDYEANEGGSGTVGAGLCPIGETYSRSKASGTGVCTKNLVDLATGRSTDMKFTGMRLTFLPNRQAMDALKVSARGQTLERLAKLSFIDEAQALAAQSPGAAAAVKKLSTDYHFENRLHLYRAASKVSGVPAEMIAALHANESCLAVAKLGPESGFGLDPRAHDNAECNKLLGDLVHAAPSGVLVPSDIFKRGTQNGYADVFQAAIIAAAILRKIAKAAQPTVASAVAGNADPTIQSRDLKVVDNPTFECGDVQPYQIAAMSGAYVAGESSAEVKKAALEGVNFMFNPSDANPCVYHPGGTSVAADGSIIQVPAGYKEWLTRWDSLLPLFVDWLADIR